MSHLLNSGRVGHLAKDVNKNEYILNRWDALGFLEGLVGDTKIKTALSFEIAVHYMKMDDKAEEILDKLSGKIHKTNSFLIDDYRYMNVSDYLPTVIFPIIRRVVSRAPEASDYVFEIITLSKRIYNSSLWKGIVSRNENMIAHFYNNVLPLFSEYHRDRRELKTYKEVKDHYYKKYLEKSSGYGNVSPYEEFECIDLEAEFAAMASERIEMLIQEYIRDNEIR